MQKLTSIRVIASILTLLLTSCAPEQIAPAAPPPSPQPMLPPATPIPTDEPAGVGVPVINYTNRGNQLIVVSSVTGKTLDAFIPISLGTYYNYAFSPDRRTLAVASAAQLYLIDLPSWKVSKFDVGLHGVVSSVVYSPDGSLLALTSGGPEGYLRIADAASGEVKAGGTAGFTIRKAQFTSNGKALMLYGPQLAKSGPFANAGVSTGAPRAALMSVPDLKLLWSVELNDVRDGTFPKRPDMPNTQDIYQPGAAWHFEPGIAFAPGRDLLYAVHGDADRLTTVDFVARSVRTVDVQPHLSWFERLLALTAGVAHAKGMDGTVKQAVVSPDGNFLYVVGSTETATQQPNGDWSITDTSPGLEVIMTADGALVDKMDTTATTETLLPAGQQLLLSGWKMNANSSTPWAEIYELSSRSLVKHVENVYLFPTRRLDGKTVLASNNPVRDNRCDMAWVDPTTWAITSTWNGTNCPAWLIDP